MTNAELIAQAREVHGVCGCEHECGDDGDIDGPGVCRGLPRPKPTPMVEVVLIHRDDLAESTQP